MLIANWGSQLRVCRSLGAKMYFCLVSASRALDSLAGDHFIVGKLIGNNVTLSWVTRFEVRERQT
jgi:hypothetical protein